MNSGCTAHVEIGTAPVDPLVLGRHVAVKGKSAINSHHAICFIVSAVIVGEYVSVNIS